MTGRAVRATAIGELVGPTAALLLSMGIVLHPSDPPSPVLDRGTVMESRCIDGRITESIDDGNPAGWLAYDTGVSC